MRGDCSTTAGFMTVDIRMADWEEFTEQATEEIYRECDVEIDGELFSSAGLRAKGNNSLHLTEEYGLKRYSLKIELIISGRKYILRA